VISLRCHSSVNEEVVNFENTVPLAYTCIMQSIVETLTYLKAVSALYTEAERADIVSAIASDPEAGDLMPETGG